MTSFDFSGQTAIVTGAGRGLGRAHAMALAARGAHVFINDMSAQNAGDVASEIAALGGLATGVAGSVADPQDMHALAETALATTGRIDMLLANAGNIRDMPFEALTTADIQTVLDVHVHGSFNACQAVLPAMRRQAYGRILLTASAAGYFGTSQEANYSAAKAAIHGLMRSMIIDISEGIRVNAIAPIAATPMTDGFWDAETTVRFSTECVTPGAIVLLGPDAPQGYILAAAGGSFVRIQIAETDGVYLAPAELTAEQLWARWDELSAGGVAVDHTRSGLHLQKLVDLAKRHNAGGG